MRPGESGDTVVLDKPYEQGLMREFVDALPTQDQEPFGTQQQNGEWQVPADRYQYVLDSFKDEYKTRKLSPDERFELGDIQRGEYDRHRMWLRDTLINGGDLS
jgi:hypothetical protein